MDVSTAKQIVRDCIKAGGGFDAAADWMSCAKSTLHDLGNRDKPDDPRNKPLSWHLKLQEFAQAPIFTRALAESEGFVLMSAEAKQDLDIGQALIRFVGSGGDLAKVIATALEDGVVDQLERREAREKVRDVQANVIKLTEAIECASKRAS